MAHNHDHESTVFTNTVKSILKNKIGGHADHGLKDGMVMSFHGGYSETILFDFWNTSTIPSKLLHILIDPLKNDTQSTFFLFYKYLYFLVRSCLLLPVYMKE